MAMRPCKKCGIVGNKKWNYHFDDDTQMITATCKKCGNVVKFYAKKKKPKPDYLRVWGEFEMRDGKEFLKTNLDNDFREVGLFKGHDKKGKWFMQVVNIAQANYFPKNI